MLGSVCNRAKLRGCTDDFLFSRHGCPGFDHSKLWSTAKEHLHLHGITCPADRAIMGSSGARQGKGFARTPCILWADNTGRFARIGKPTWFKLFMEAEDDVIEALCTLCDDADMSEDFQLTLAQFVCTVYRPKGTSSQAFQSCVGTCSANTWQKVRSYHLPWEPSNNTFWGLKVEYGARLQYPSRNCWTPCWMATTATATTDSSSQPPLMSHQHLRPSWRWSGV